MNDLKKHLLPMEQVQMPDQWQDIERRQPRPEPDQRTSRWSRIGVVAAALVIAIGGVALAVTALSGHGDRLSSLRTIGPPVATNGVIAYASIGKQGVFWTIRPDGSDRTQVHVDVPGFVRVPSWSPDGTRIAFDVDSFDDPHPESGNFDIYTANADGTDATRLTFEQVDHSPALSPDGTRIAYVHGWDDQQIWVMHADGSDPHQLTDEKGPNLFPSWSPDGTKIAFVSFVGSNADIYSMNSDGSEIRRLTDDPAHEDQPIWSPDGRRIAFTSDGAGESGIYAMSPDGTGVTELTRDTDPANLGIAWSPDGTKMAIVSIRGPGYDRNVYVLDVATGDLTTIGEPGAYFGPSWQPLPVSNASPFPSVSSSGTPELTGTARIIATIPLPEGTIGGGLAVGAGSTWSGLNDSHGRDGAVVRIDPATNQIVATIAVEKGPSRKRIAATDDAVWVASTGLLQRIDPATNSVVANVDIPGRYTSAIAADSSDVWALTIDADGGVLVRIDTATNAIVAEIPLGSQITGYEDEVQIGAGSVWVIGVTWIERENAEYGSDLIRVDPATNTVAARIPVGGFRMAVGPDAVWVSFPADGVFDTSGEHWLWTKVDLRTNEASPPFRFQGGGLQLVTADGLWSVDYDEQEYVRVTRFDAQTLSVESRSEPVRSYFHDAVLDRSSGTVWVATLDAIVRLDIS